MKKPDRPIQHDEIGPKEDEECRPFKVYVTRKTIVSVGG